MTSGGNAGRGTSRLRGGLLLALLLGYALFIHHGVGPLPDTLRVAWWTPRELLIGTPLLDLFAGRPLFAAAVFTLPALAMAARLFVMSRSALARTLALAAVFAVALFLFYGLRPPGPQIWGFFGWRGSAVMATLALVVAAAACAPLLAASWLRLPPVARAASYGVVFFAVVAALRNVTGTNPSLRFAISPWPVVTVFGLGIGAQALLGVLAGAALALGALAWPRRRALVAPAGVALGLAVPVAWLGWRVSPAPAFVLPLVFATGLAILVALRRTGLRLHALRRRARAVGLGALLLGAPLATGHAWVQRDYEVTRNQRAQGVIDALGRFYARDAQYPDTLSALVESGDLEGELRPRIGFGFLSSDSSFTYQSFGNGYLLEFSAPEWAQCAYNPPWHEEDSGDAYEDEDAQGEEAEGDAGGAEGLPGAWSCPSNPPKLW